MEILAPVIVETSNEIPLVDDFDSSYSETELFSSVDESDSEAARIVTDYLARFCLSFNHILADRAVSTLSKIIRTPS